jgi:hypothetical protein
LGHIQAISDKYKKPLKWVVHPTLKDSFPNPVDIIFDLHFRPNLRHRLKDARQELEKLGFDREAGASSQNRKSRFCDPFAPGEEPQCVEDSDASLNECNKDGTWSRSLGKPRISGKSDQIGRNGG